MKKLHIKHIWLFFGAYGVWFAIFSGFEEVLIGKYWKMISALVLGAIAYIFFEYKLDNKK